MGYTSLLSPDQVLEDVRSRGEALADGKWRAMLEGIESDISRHNTALALENTARYISSIDETTRAHQIGNFDRYALPMVRAVMPSLIAQNLVSVQTLPGPTGVIVYYNVLYGSNKGRIRAGQPVFSALTGHPGTTGFVGDEVEEEPCDTGTGSATTFGRSLDYTPVMPGTLVITDGTMTVTDDGQGNLTGDVDAAGANSIDYLSGAFEVQFASAPASGASIVASYSYDNEANSQVPEIDFQFTVVPVYAKTDKLQSRYSLEAAQTARQVYGISAETELMTAQAQTLRFEIDRRIINDLNSFAQADSVSWPLSPSTGISYTEHKLSFVDKLIEGSNNIFNLLRRGHANWIVLGTRVSNIIESLPSFQAAPGLRDQSGVAYVGDLMGRWRIYKDPYNIDGSASQRNFLIGWKGGTWLESGYVYAPHIPFYTTPTLVMPDFVARFGMATSWARRKINGRFYCRGLVTGQLTP